MAEAFPLTEAGIDTSEDTLEVENQPFDPKSNAFGVKVTTRRKKRLRPISDNPSPRGDKPPQPGFNSNPIQFNQSVPPSVEKLALKGQVSNSPELSAKHYEQK